MQGSSYRKRRAIAGLLSAGLLAAVSASSSATPAPVPATIPVALAIDLSTGQELFAREENRRFVPASVVKVMTAYTAFQLIKQGRLSTGRRYQISQELEDEWSGEGSSMFLLEGERPTIGELLLGATTVSGNDASVALALAVSGSVEGWVELMNQNAAALGMRDTNFGSANGFPDEGRTFTSAHDLALLGGAVVTQHPGLYHRYFGHRGLAWRGRVQENHDPVTGRVPGADGLKTGFTSEAGFTFVGSGEREGRRIVIVLAGAQTGEERDDAARALLEWSLSGFTTRQLAPAGAPIGQALVQDGSANSVPLRTVQPLRLSLPVGEEADVTMTVRYQGPLMAPVAAGDQVAVLHLDIAGQPGLDVPLEAAASVEQAGFFRRIGNALAGWFG